MAINNIMTKDNHHHSHHDNHDHSHHSHHHDYPYHHHHDLTMTMIVGLAIYPSIYLPIYLSIYSYSMLCYELWCYTITIYYYTILFYLRVCFVVPLKAGSGGINIVGPSVPLSASTRFSPHDWGIFCSPLEPSINMDHAYLSTVGIINTAY